MRNAKRVGLCIGIVCLLPAVLSPATASAGKTQESIFQDEALLNLDPGGRVAQLNEVKDLGATTIHLLVNWQGLAPDPTAKHKPSFNDQSPSGYSDSKWSKYDQFLTTARSLGFDVILAPNGPAPKWAQKGHAKGSGGLASYKPDPKLFGNFAEALGERYDGSFPNPDGSGNLPNINRWSFWNEPNQGGWLQPQTVGQIPQAPHIYRNLQRAGVQGLVRAGQGGDQFLIGELAPIGTGGTGPTHAMSPGQFLREMFCLDNRYKPFKGAAAKARGCNGFKKIKASGFAMHPYPKNFSSLTVPKDPDWMPIAASNRLSNILNKAAARGRIARGLPIYFTEFGIQSNPPDRIAGVSLSKQAAYMNDAEYLSYKFGRSRSFVQFELHDDPLFTQFPASDPRRYGGFQTGLIFQDGRHKPSYDAYRLPIHVKRLSSSKVLVWGMVRPIDDGPRSVQLKANGSDVGVPIGITNQRGYFQRTVSRSGAGGANWSFVWQDTDGRAFSSRSTKPTRK